MVEQSGDKHSPQIVEAIVQVTRLLPQEYFEQRAEEEIWDVSALQAQATRSSV